MPEKTCSAFGCDKPASKTIRRGRISAWVCEQHAPANNIEAMEIAKATTGSKECDRMVNDAVRSAMFRLEPIIREIMREEIKRHVQFEAIDENDKIESK